MATAVEIIFAGLIAFVPNGTETATSVTAYVVKADDHRKPLLTVFGDAGLSGEGTCSKTGKTIKCDLADTDISITNLMTTSPLRLPRKPPEHRFPNPDVLGDVHSLDWLIRMSNIENGIGKADPDKLKTLTGARITFASNDLSSSELDGSEAGRPALIGVGSFLRQVVGESLFLQLKVNSDNVVISLLDRQSRKTQTITATCHGGTCLGMEISNNFTGVSVCGDGDHFKHYYDLVKNSGTRRLPFSVDSRPCLKGQKRRVDFDSLDHILRVIRPIAPAKVDAFVANLKNEKFRKKLKNQQKLQNQINAALWDAIQDLLKVQDRIICPPVLLEAP